MAAAKAVTNALLTQPDDWCSFLALNLGIQVRTESETLCYMRRCTDWSTHMLDARVLLLPSLTVDLSSNQP